jgi:chromosome partitioning protein
MIFAFTNSKGGVGKSTMAVHFAVWLQEQGHSIALVDSDVQGSSSVWLHEAEPQISIFRLQTPDDLLEQVPKLQQQFENIMIDGPGGLSEVTRTILFVADVTFVPCGPSVLDVRAANEAIRVIRQAQTIRHGPPQAVFVPNKIQARYRLSREFIETAKALAIPTGPGLRLRQAYADAAGQGTVVWRLENANEAASEMNALLKELYATKHEENHERSIANS